MFNLKHPVCIPVCVCIVYEKRIIWPEKDKIMIQMAFCENIAEIMQCVLDIQ